MCLEDVHPRAVQAGEQLALHADVVTRGNADDEAAPRVLVLLVLALGLLVGGGGDLAAAADGARADDGRGAAVHRQCPVEEDRQRRRRLWAGTRAQAIEQPLLGIDARRGRSSRAQRAAPGQAGGPLKRWVAAWAAVRAKGASTLREHPHDGGVDAWREHSLARLAALVGERLRGVGHHVGELATRHHGRAHEELLRLGVAVLGDPARLGRARLGLGRGVARVREDAREELVRGWDWG
eukprot:scaffold95227_cov50-Phaeocystis_antarctica.AAC.1